MKLFGLKILDQNPSKQNLPGGPAVKNLPCNAGFVGLIPSWGTKTSQAVQQVSPSAAPPENHKSRVPACQWKFHTPQLRPGAPNNGLINIQKESGNKISQ